MTIGKGRVPLLLLLLSSNSFAAKYPIECLYVDVVTGTELTNHPNCAAIVDANPVFSPQHLSKMFFNRGLAAVNVQQQWYYVMRSGRSLAVIAFDNGADNFSEGLVRSLVNGKVSYFDRRLRQVIPPNHDWGWPFENDRALVCDGCKLGQPDAEGHIAVSDGDWYYINKSGRAVAPYPAYHATPDT